jgi:hypothetical protein
LDGNCSSAISAVANASVITHSSWPVIPFLGIESVLFDRRYQGRSTQLWAAIRIKLKYLGKKATFKTELPKAGPAAG